MFFFNRVKQYIELLSVLLITTIHESMSVKCPHIRLFRLVLAVMLCGVCPVARAQTAAPEGKSPRHYTLSGRVEDLTSGEQMIGVSIMAPYQDMGTQTSNFGYYSLTLNTDTATIRISSLGYRTLDTFLELKHDLVMHFKMATSPTSELQTVTVSGNKNQEIQNTSQMGRINIPVSQIQSLPKFFGESDVLKALQTLPGVQQGSEGTSTLLVRGGSADQNLILLDGAPLYNPAHLLGIFSAFNTYALKNVELYKGAFPARYGGRLSSVIDIAMKDGDLHKIHGAFSLGVLASQLTVEGPIKKGKTSFIVSGRRTYHDLYAAPILKNSDQEVKKFALYFYDVNAKIHHRFSEKDHLYLSGYMGGDKARVKTRNEYGTDGDYDGTDTDLRWGNITGTLRWSHIFSPWLFVNSTLTTTRYRFATDLASESKFGGQISNYTLGISSGIVDYSGRTEFDYQPNTRHSIKTGLAYTLHTFNPGSNYYRESYNTNPISSVSIDNKVNGSELDLYAEDDWEISSKLKANIGLHGSAFLVQDTRYFSLQPRISARYLLPGDWALKAAYARMTEYMHLLASNSLSLPTDLWVPATANVKPQQSDQVSLGIARSIWNNAFEFSVETYYKKLDNILEYREGSSYLLAGNSWEDKVAAGKGSAYGAEFFLQKKAGKLTGWVGYTLAWANRTLPDINNGKTFPYKYDRRHTLNLVAVYKWKHGIELSGTFLYQSPTPFTLTTMEYESVHQPGPDDPYNTYTVPYVSSRNNIRIQSTHRLDVSISFIKEKRNGNIRTWNISVYNVYNHKNLFFYEADRYEGDQVVIKGYSIMPILPSISYSLKF